MLVQHFQQRFGVHIPGGHKEGISGSEMLLVKPNAIVAADIFQRFFSPLQLRSVWSPTVQLAAELHRSQVAWIRLILLQRSNELAAFAVKFIVWEGGAQHNIGHHRQRLRKKSGKHAKPHGDFVAPGTGIQHRAQVINIVGNLLHGSVGRTA